MTRIDVVGPLALRVGQSATRTKTITETDLRAYAEITGDYNPLHFDDAFAAGTRFGRRVAQGEITAGLLNALVAMDLPGPGTVFSQAGTLILSAEAWTYTLRPVDEKPQPP